MNIRGPKVHLALGDRILTAAVIVVVKAITRHGIEAEDPQGIIDFISYDKLVATTVDSSGVQAVHEALQPWWSALDEQTRAETLFKLEVVLEVLTGYRLGFAFLAHPGEPFHPFGTGFGVSLTKRTDAMARQISFERSADREMMRRVREGELVTETISGQTIRLWIRAFQQRGVRGLVDGRKTRTLKGFDDLDPRYLRIADEELARFTGEESAVNLGEIERRILVRLKDEHGSGDDKMPQRLTQEYLSIQYRALGRGTRAHKSRAHRRVASKSSYPVLHPGHLVCDFTRIDNFVRDELLERPISIEVEAYLSVSSRVVVSLRVTPRSGRAIDASLGMYDALRPQALVVDQTSISDFRWAGVPESIEWAANPVTRRQRLVSGKQTIQGEHQLPGVAAASLRSDNGSIYLSRQFRTVLHHWGIDHYPSRGKKPNDNPQQERTWNSWIQRALQAIPGYKGRSVFERGALVITAEEPLLTWRQLETYLRRFVALEYHRTPHDGLLIPGMQGAKITPLEMFDHLLEVCGRITVPQHPDLIFDFLPVVWLTPGHAGVKHRGFWYDGRILDSIGNVRPGTYRSKDARVPFIVDPRDPMRLWHRSIDDGRVHELQMRQAHLLDQPLTEFLRDLALQQLRQRGGNNAISRRMVKREIVHELGSIAATITDPKARNQMSAAHIRWEQSRIDHAESTDAAHQSLERITGVRHVHPAPTAPDAEQETGLDYLAVWPDYEVDDEVG